MLSTESLTTKDLDQIGLSFGRQPSSKAAELVDAVDRGLVADPADISYALTTAAEIIARDGDLQAAEVLARRAVEAHRSDGDPKYGFPRAFHAKLLMRLGHEGQALAELTALRPLLLERFDAASYVCGTLEECGQAELAEQWVTEALRTVIAHRETRESLTGQPTDGSGSTVMFTLAQYRHRLRAELELPHDDLDDLADDLMEAMNRALGGDIQEDTGIALLFWPQQEFHQLLLRWPALVEDYGHTWDGYRANVQQNLLRLSDSGAPRLALLIGAADELATYAQQIGGDPADLVVRQRYSEHLEEHPRLIVWPPGRNNPCWCGSAQKYKKCCLPRTRT